jgi:hypothetical protein
MDGKRPFDGKAGTSGDHFKVEAPLLAQRWWGEKFAANLVNCQIAMV